MFNIISELLTSMLLIYTSWGPYSSFLNEFGDRSFDVAISSVHVVMFLHVNSHSEVE